MSWYLPATVSSNDSQYIFINDNSYLNGSNQYILTQNILSNYRYLDYILVGGGGGGGGGADAEGSCDTGAGGGGSGYLTATFTYSGTNNGFTYNINQLPPNTPGQYNNVGTIDAYNCSQVVVTIGNGGAGASTGCNLTSIGNCQSGTQGALTSLDYTPIGGISIRGANAFGGLGGQGGGYKICGNGGNGFNGGGGGASGGDDCIGTITGSIGGTGVSGYGGNNGGNGTVGLSGKSGSGGGTDGGVGQPNSGTLVGGASAGGGGGGGSGVTYTGPTTTGGRGSQTDISLPSIYTITPLDGINFSGGGGGGGSAYTNNFSSPNIGYGSNGGKGYAILWLHN